MEGTDTAQGQDMREFWTGASGSLCSGDLGPGLEHDLATFSFISLLGLDKVRQLLLSGFVQLWAMQGFMSRSNLRTCIVWF